MDKQENQKINEKTLDEKEKTDISSKQDEENLDLEKKKMPT